MKTSIALLSLLFLSAGCTNERGGPPGAPVDGDAGVGPGQDGGSVIDPPPPPPVMSGACDGVPAEGECVGNTLRFCLDGVVEERDCGGIYPAPATGTCEDIVELGGPVCALQPGDRCVYDTTGGDPHYAPCAGANAGCIWTDTGNECRENVGACLGDRISCNGDNLVFGCLAPPGTAGQPLLIECTDLGGTCSAPSCVGLPEGAQCAVPTLNCGEDLTCEEGRCVPDGPVTIRSCSGSSMSGACTNTADCGIIDGDPEGIFAAGIGCLSESDVGACVESMTGLSSACSACFADPEGSRFQACAGF